MQTVTRQLRNKDLYTFSVNTKGRPGGVDLNEIMRKVQSVLTPLVWGNGAIAMHIALSPEPLKILAASDLMVGAVLTLVRSALQALPGGGELWLSTAQVNLTYQSILDDTQYQYGACAALAIRSKGIDDWCRFPDPTLAGETVTDKGCELSTAHTIIKQHHGSMRTERTAEHGTTVTVYLPLARLAVRLAARREFT